ncbi:MAG TPA: TylF/MycF/NovP-related O-methyltransferase [Candidatus Gastranaerophilales bacterium]|nr:TylF/MycF/NovP-related O-methyltransferase [Candidatus Gastranaerophilales bacterium]
MRTRDKKSQSGNDLNQFEAITELFENENQELIEKIEAFGKYASRQSIGKFLTKYEIFKQILNVNGSIIECGVLHGAGLLTWAKLSSLFEPANHPRKVIGFDTFEGFPSVNIKDKATGTFNDLNKGGLQGSSYDDVQKAVRIYDMNRPISHIPKVELVKGDLCKTSEEYIEQNPHLVVSLLYLDVDLYEPTKKALEVFVPRMPKGAIIVFDELNAKIFPGETQAVNEVLGLKNLEIKRFSFDSYVSYAVLK